MYLHNRIPAKKHWLCNSLLGSVLCQRSNTCNKFCFIGSAGPQEHTSPFEEGQKAPHIIVSALKLPLASVPAAIEFLQEGFPPNRYAVFVRPPYNYVSPIEPPKLRVLHHVNKSASYVWCLVFLFFLQWYLSHVRV